MTPALAGQHSHPRDHLRVGVDCAVPGPVPETRTHPDATLLSRDGLERAIAGRRVPACTLGGLAQDDLAVALEAGRTGSR